MTTQVEHNRMANAIRFLSADAVEKANSGHPGMPMAWQTLRLFFAIQILEIRSEAPELPTATVSSVGWSRLMLYSLPDGYEDFDLDQIKNFRQMGFRTAGHPEFAMAQVSKPPPAAGQGIATSVGFALGERIMNARFGDDVVDHYTHVIAGDGCLMEGISQEAISMAGHETVETDRPV